MDELFREIKIRGHLEELKKLPDPRSRIARLDEILVQINISKERLSFYSPDEQTYLFFRIQEKEIDMGICPHFYIFYSKKYQKFHHYCRDSTPSEKQRTYCNGLEIKCTFTHR
jgi:hypothetical protein